MQSELAGVKHVRRQGARHVIHAELDTPIFDLKAEVHKEGDAPNWRRELRCRQIGILLLSGVQRCAAR